MHRFGDGVLDLLEPDLPIEHPCDGIAVGGKSRRAAFPKLARGAAIERNQPYILFSALREKRGIRRQLLWIISIAAADINDGFCIRRPLQIRDLLAIIVWILCNLARYIAVAIASW